MMERELWAHSRKDSLNREPADGAVCVVGGSAFSRKTPPVQTPLEVDVLDVDTALDEFDNFDRCKARVAKLRFFAGLSLEEIGLVIDTSLTRRCKTGRRRAPGYSSV